MNNDIVLRAPSKTFLIGEYIALMGGPALVLNTPPYFELVRQAPLPGEKILSLDFSTDSPAGKLIVQHRMQLENLRIQSLRFIDPHYGQGGLGASSAQFALLAKLLGYTDPWQVLALYQKLAQPQAGPIPSGADVIAQWSGGITYFHAQTHKIEKISWPFLDLSIALIHTQQKVSTHEHLRSLAPNTMEQLGELNTIALETYHALIAQNPAAFTQAINNYAMQLQQKKLVAGHTLNLLDKIRQQNSVIACKGCGAMGADVILVIIPTCNKAEFCAWAKHLKLSLIFCDNIFSDGILA